MRLELPSTALRRYRAPLLLAVALLGAGVAFGPRLLEGPQVSLIAVVQRDFVQTWLPAAGRIASASARRSPAP